MKILTDRAPRAHHRDGGDILGIGGRVVAATRNAAVIVGAGIATVLRSESCRRDHAGPPCVASGGGRERQRRVCLPGGYRARRAGIPAAAADRLVPTYSRLCGHRGARPGRQPASGATLRHSLASPPPHQNRRPGERVGRHRLSPDRSQPHDAARRGLAAPTIRLLISAASSARSTPPPPAQHTQRRYAARPRRDDDPPLAQRHGLDTLDAAAPAARTPPSATARRRSAGPGRP